LYLPENSKNLKLKNVPYSEKWQASQSGKISYFSYKNPDYAITAER
jgi:hypothetical protein